MTFIFYTNSVSPHQLPLASEMVKLFGEDMYKYIYTDKLTDERLKMGWSDSSIPKWCKIGDATSKDLIESDVLMSGLRLLKVFEKRANLSKMTIYCSERWFKPIIGFLRLLRPSYFKMALKIVKLLSSDSKFYYFPMGIHAARDMARLCGMMHGDLRCLFRAPELEFERRPGGKIWLKDKKIDSENSRKYCLDKMRMWGYYVKPSGIDALPVQEMAKTNREVVRVLWVGRLLNLKRVDTIVRAVGEHMNLKRVDDSLPKITLDIYGVGPEEKRLKKMAAKYGDVIKFHPPVPIDEVRKLMRSHDVYVLSSNAYEGWGAVVSEALEEGMKVVGTYEAGASATMLPESNLFHAGDCRRLMNILRDPCVDVRIGSWSVKSAAEYIGCDVLKDFSEINSIKLVYERRGL